MRQIIVKINIQGLYIAKRVNYELDERLFHKLYIQKMIEKNF